MLVEYFLNLFKLRLLDNYVQFPSNYLGCLGWVFYGINYKLLPLGPETEKTFERHINDS